MPHGGGAAILWAWPPLLKKPAAAGSASRPIAGVLALLVLEGFLLLSEWFRRFPFNQHKGWSVLICLAAVGAALVLMFLWFLAALVFRLRFQFGILSLLLLVVVVAVPCSWLATEMKAAKTQRKAAAEVAKFQGEVLMIIKSIQIGNRLPGVAPPGPVAAQAARKRHAGERNGG